MSTSVAMRCIKTNGTAIAHEDTIVIEVYDGPHYPIKPDWYTDEQDAR